MTKARLRALLREWQKRLRLQDWELDLVFEADSEMPDMWGHVSCFIPAKRSARITMVDPATIAQQGDDDEREDYDPEETLVHEILHVYTAQAEQPGTDRYSVERIAHEQMADAVAVAMVGLKRGK